MRLSRILSFSFLLSLWCSSATAQTSHIGGVINSYTAISAIDYCENKVTVASTSGFAVGQKVLLIQMKGASINLANNSTFGDIFSYVYCGNYEVEKIKSITGNEVVFEFLIERMYAAASSVQMISIPEYSTAIVDSTLRAKAWNGSDGGVLVLQCDSLILNANVDVKGKGFLGAVRVNDNAGQACFNGGNGGATDFFCATVECGAPKGEGIGTPTAPFGRGKAGNGGGGGDDHNTGGGGGSNYGAGGQGGVRSNVSQFSCPGPAPGIGGAALDYNNTANKTFMGGGGGAGDENNNEGSSGANGGGIFLLMADVLVGNNKRIMADGDDVATLAQSDGAGGGGGGGTVMLSVNTISGNLIIDANGGDGGVLDNAGIPNYCFGPGAGGGGGVLWVKGNAVPPNVTYRDTGGINGRNVFGIGSPQCPTGTTNLATPGDTGGIVTNLVIPIADTPYVKFEAAVCCDTTVCSGAPVHFASTATGMPPLTFVWSNGQLQPNFTEPVYATTVYTVTIADGGHCQIPFNITVTVQNNPPDLSVCCDTTVCAGTPVHFNVVNNSGTPLTYLWSNGDTTTSITPTAYYSQGYFVNATDASGCVVTKTVSVTVPNTALSVIADPDTAILLGQTVQLLALSDTTYTYHWSPSTGLSNADIYNPLASPQEATNYCVTVTDPSTCSTSACVYIDLIIPDIKVPDAFSPNGDGNNDLFVVFPLKFAEIFEINIYNRWGETVFHAKGNQPWDGTYKGRFQNEGAYVVTVKYGSPLAPGDSKLLTKNLILIR
ncbi:MAG: gliding motility-associated C-terminal domain-containing protein [Chitinophagales bacterium]